MHVPPPGALGSHQAIVVAWGVNAWHLGIFFKVSRIQNLMWVWGHALAAKAAKVPCSLANCVA